MTNETDLATGGTVEEPFLPGENWTGVLPESILSDLKGSLGGRPATVKMTAVEMSPAFREVIEDATAPRNAVTMVGRDGAKVTLNNVSFVIKDKYMPQDTLGGYVSTTNQEYVFETKDQKIARLENELVTARMDAAAFESRADRLLTLLETSMGVDES